ncbi:MAG: RHS repeat-associated core domain-containing protein [Stenotrophomonas sp.]
MQQRFQDPVTGRFLSVDPVSVHSADDRHFNRYAYAYNNPYRFNDPDGRCPICLGAVIGGGIEIGMQFVTKGKVDNWTAVGVSAAVGAVTGGVGSILAKAAVSTTTAVVGTAAVGGAASGVGKVAEGQLTGQAVSSKK